MNLSRYSILGQTFTEFRPYQLRYFASCLYIPGIYALLHQCPNDQIVYVGMSTVGVGGRLKDEWSANHNAAYRRYVTAPNIRGSIYFTYLKIEEDVLEKIDPSFRPESFDKLLFAIEDYFIDLFKPFTNVVRPDVEKIEYAKRLYAMLREPEINVERIII